MTQLDLALPPMHALSVYTRIDGKLAQFDTHSEQVLPALIAVHEALDQDKVRHGTILALVRNPLPTVNTDRE